MQAVQQQVGFGAVFDVWRRRKWLAIVMCAWVLAGVTSVAFFLPDVYQSAATILVERQQVPEAFVQTTVTSGLDVRLQTITQQVLSRSRLESLINRFGLYEDMRQRVPLEEVIETMRRDISLERRGQERRYGKEEATVAFAISYRGRNRQQVAQVTNALASFYIDENLKVREQQAAGTAEFLRVQLEEMRQRLESQEKLVSQFKERHMGELPEQLPANIAVLEGLNMQLRINGEKRSRTSAQLTMLAQHLTEIEALRQRRPSSEPLGESKPEPPDPALVRLEKLRQDLAILRTRYSETYPDIVSLKFEIAALEAQIPKRPESKKPLSVAEQPPLNPFAQQMKKEIGSLEAELKGLQTEEQGLLRSIAIYQQRVEATPRRDQEMQGLRRNYDTAKELYQSLQKRQEEAKLAEHLELRQKGEQFRLIEPAVPGDKPVEPKRRKILVMGLLMALGLAVGAVVVQEHMDSSFHTVADLRAFSPVPVLVSLPRTVTKAEAWRRRWWFGLKALSATLSLGLIVGMTYVVIQGPASLLVLYTQLQSLR